MYKYKYFFGVWTIFMKTDRRKRYMRFVLFPSLRRYERIEQTELFKFSFCT